MNDPKFVQLFYATSVAALIFQISATALIAVLSFVVSRAVRRWQMLYYAGGWACYAVALIAIMFASRSGPLDPPLYFGYFFFEYAAVLLIFAGCRSTATGEGLAGWTWWTLAPAAVVAVALAASTMATSFTWPYAVHTTIIGLSWAACLLALRPALRRAGAGPGVRIVAAGLVLLALDYLQHLPINWYLLAHHATQSPYYYTFFSVVDGMLEFVLGFGTVVVIVDEERAELEAANTDLKRARDRTEQALHTDPLTSVLSRYSFAATFETDNDRRAHRSGCVVVVDLDGLKFVNDCFGHAAGDAAIRAVADGLRSLIRQGDRVYRWGGDEFVVVLPEMPVEAVRRRMQNLDDVVNRYLDATHADAGPVRVSWGASVFDAAVPIRAAIEQADAAMYDVKVQRKASAFEVIDDP